MKLIAEIISDEKTVTPPTREIMLTCNMENKDRRKTYDLPEARNIKRDSIEAFRSARESRSRIGISGDPLLSDRSSFRHSGRVAAAGYTGYRPQCEEFESLEDNSKNFCVSPIKKSEKIRGYTGYIPGSKTDVGVRSNLGSKPVILDKSMANSKSFKLLKLQSSNHFTESDMPRCKYRVPTETKKLRPGHPDYITHRYGSLQNMKKRYADAVEQVEKSGQTQRSLLTLVQSKLSERVNSYARQVIRTRNLFQYYDFDDSNTLDEDEFQMFLEGCNCYLNEAQRIALFSYFDTDNLGGICWATFQKNCTVPNPKGGTAVLPKAITRTYTLDM